MDKNKTWESINLPKEKKTVGCKWVFSTKYKDDGSLERYKTQSAEKGYNGVDYLGTFSPVVKMDTIRIAVYIDIPPGF